MERQCKSCGHINTANSIVCSWCKADLIERKTTKIEELIAKQEQMEIRHRKEMADLKQELFTLRNNIEKTTEVEKEVKSTVDEKDVAINFAEKSAVAKEHQANPNAHKVVKAGGGHINKGRKEIKQPLTTPFKKIIGIVLIVLAASFLLKALVSSVFLYESVDGGNVFVMLALIIVGGMLLRKREEETITEKRLSGDDSASSIKAAKGVNEDNVLTKTLIEKKSVENIKVQVVEKTKEESLDTHSTSINIESSLRKAIEPLYDGLDLITKVYTKYKTEGKLPIFFMTIAGIVAILFGFGYLMQYSLSAAGIYQGLIKVSLGFGAAFTAIVIGLRLSKKESDLKEYASALISLGVILNYVMIYYLTELGDFPALSESFLGFLLIVANTGIAIFFALKFEAKIIAVLFVVGGAFAPFYLNANEDGTLYYLYLWFLTVGACYVSIKIEWKTLQYFAFSISALLLEITVFVHEPTSYLYVGYYHLFGYLFFYFTFFNNAKIKQELDKIDLVVLASNLGLFSWNLFSALQSNLVVLGVVYLVNALVFIGVLIKYKQALDKIGRLVLLIIVGLFVGLAIPSFFNQSVIGLFWSIEAIMLVYLGFLYHNEFIRKEGYLLLGIAIAKLGWHSAEIVYFWNQTLWHSGLMNFIVLGLVISLCWVFGQRYKASFNKFEEFLFVLFREIVPVWLAIIFFLLSYGSLGLWSFPLSVISVYGLIYWGKLFNTHTSVWFGFSHLLFLLLGLLISMAEVGSFHFSDQLLYAQVSVVLLIASLWGLKSYFKIIDFQSDFSYEMSKGLRVVFFCLMPLLFVHFVRKIDVYYVGSAVWISVLITYFLYQKLRYLALNIELIILTILSFLFVIGTLNQLGIVVGIFVMITLVILEKAYSKEEYLSSDFKGLLVFVPYIVIALIWFIGFYLSDENGGMAFAFVSLLLIVLVLQKDRLALVNASYILATKLSVIFLFFSFTAYPFYENSFVPLFSIIYLIILGVLLYNKKGWYDIEKKINRWNFTFVLHQLAVIITIAILLGQLRIEFLGPLSSVLLVVHAIILVFIALKQHRPFINKVSMVLFGIALLKVIVLDISEFSMVQKVVVFLILGLLLLAASYGYVKLKKRFDTSDKNNELDEEVV